jgi:hypothetical protein
MRFCSPAGLALEIVPMLRRGNDPPVLANIKQPAHPRDELESCRFDEHREENSQEKGEIPQCIRMPYLCWRCFALCITLRLIKEEIESGPQPLLGHRPFTSCSRLF